LLRAARRCVADAVNAGAVAADAEEALTLVLAGGLLGSLTADRLPDGARLCEVFERCW
jgi:hypothetical protein